MARPRPSSNAGRPRAAARRASRAVSAAVAIAVALGAGANPSRADEHVSQAQGRAGPRAPVAYTPHDGALLARAAAFEHAGDAHAAATIYRSLAARYPDDSAAQWRAARALYLMATQLPVERRDDRELLFEQARVTAESALARDPDCAGCALYLTAAYGGLAPIRGVLWSARRVGRIKAALDHAIALRPGDRDSANNSLLANLYLARASLQRLVPEWRWLTFVIGMRGDLDAALDDIGRARALHADRVDFQVEQAILHLCRAERRDRPTERSLGLQLLREAAVAPHTMPTDALDQALARRLLEDASRACEVTRSGTLDIEENRR